MNTKLYFCETHHNVDPPIDINPLILQRYPEDKILVICARQNPLNRIERLRLNNVLAVGWWELEEVELSSAGYIVYEELKKYPVVVIVGRHRIAEEFRPLLYQIEKMIKAC